MCVIHKLARNNVFYFMFEQAKYTLPALQFLQGYFFMLYPGFSYLFLISVETKHNHFPKEIYFLASMLKLRHFYSIRSGLVRQTFPHSRVSQQLSFSLHYHPQSTESTRHRVRSRHCARSIFMCPLYYFILSLKTLSYYL